MQKFKANYSAYKLENSFFGYTPNNVFHFLFMYVVQNARWVV